MVFLVVILSCPKFGVWSSFLQLLEWIFSLFSRLGFLFLNWSFIMDCRYFLLVMKPPYVSAFPPITSHWVFSCFLTMPCTFLPPCLFSSHSLFLVHPPSLIAVWKPSHSSVLFTKCFKKKKKLMFSVECEYIDIYQGKITPLFLSNLCSVPFYSTVHIFNAGTLFYLCNFWNTLLIALHSAWRWGWI